MPIGSPGRSAFVPAAESATAVPLGRTDLVGQKVLLGIRAEAIHLLPPGAGQVTITVDFVEELGASRVIHCDWAGQLLAVLLTEPTAVRPGSAAGIAFPAEDVHLFSEATGRRLDGVAAAVSRELESVS